MFVGNVMKGCLIMEELNNYEVVFFYVWIVEFVLVIKCMLGNSFLIYFLCG